MPPVVRNVRSASIGEYVQQFVTRHPRPHAHAAGIHVYERRPRARIEANTAALQAQTYDAKVFERHAGNVEIHGVTEHVLAEAGDAAAAAAEHRVGFG